MKVFKTLLFVCLTTSILSQEDTTKIDSLIISNEDESVEFDDEIETFAGTRIINGHSIETLRKGVLEFRIEHRFGDIAGGNGGVQSLYGFDNSTDIRFALEYGVTDKFMVGFGRSKGTGSLGSMGSPYKSLLDGFVKYRLLHQKKNEMPISVSLIGTSSYTYMTASTDVSSVSNFPKSIYRFAYSSQINIARKFGDRLSLSIMPTLVYRNYVDQNDVNALFSLGSALRFSLTPKLGILVEYYQNFQNDNVRTTNKNSLGFAVEWKTFGHTFTINLTNSTGFGETQFIPYTFQDWLKGQFRLGFCIGRKYMRE